MDDQERGSVPVIPLHDDCILHPIQTPLSVVLSPLFLTESSLKSTQDIAETILTSLSDLAVDGHSDFVELGTGLY